jgi:hypothetical protein
VRYLPASPGTVNCFADSGSATSYPARTSSSSARLANVLSMPKTPSAIGLPLVSTSLLVSSPASPCGWIFTVMPVFFLNSAITSFDIAHESWVAMMTVSRDRFEPESVSPLPQAAVVRPIPSNARTAVRRVRMTLLRLPSPVLTGAGSRVCGWSALSAPDIAVGGLPCRVEPI